ncbi:ABC transporter permease subunit [Mesoplasma florum]|uniref:ABC transporter permease subunit n=1 Tax=Mesoplasma florum TaxID=2151 RepID=UPI000BE39852|nr:hypothetical protein [Mesoplasma florum]ATI74313.1 hypothetical protein CQZ70_03645 [Mesoplasma florum]AVN61328.1 hypothetical protein CG005_03510 [Mesoplasma florum]
MNKVSMWKFKTKQVAYVRSTTFKTKMSYVKASSISIFVGLVVGIIFLYMLGMDGIGFIFYSLFSPIFDSETTGNTIIQLSVFLLLGLGLALGFKVKLFNMGGSGQAIAGLLISYIFLTSTMGSSFQNASNGTVLLIFFMFIIFGALVSSLTGLLKIFFNIHEVATSIIINWIFWYLLKFYAIGNFGGSVTMSPPLPRLFGDYMWIFAIAFAIISIISVFVITEKTTIGYKYKIVGSQESVAKYAGINSKRIIIVVTAVQGILISAAGFFYYFGIEGSIGLSNDILPLIGFEGIPVALVAFNNFIGIIPIAILWTLLRDGIELAQSNPQYMGLPKETADLLFGIIIFFSTMYTLFIKFDGIKHIKNLVYKIKDPIFSKKIKVLKIEIWRERINIFNIYKDEELQKIKNEISTLKKKLRNSKENEKNIKIQIQELRINYKDTKKFKISKIKNSIKDIKFKINSLHSKFVLKYFDETKPGLRKIYIASYNKVTYLALDNIAEKEAQIFDIDENNNDKSKILEIKNEILNIIQNHEKDVKDVKKKYKENKVFAKNYLKEIKTDFKNKKNNLKSDKKNYKQNLNILKAELIEKQMEVLSKYGNNI